MFELQWELLKVELEHIESAIGRIDGIAQTIKNWTVLLWAGSLAILFDKDHTDLRKFAWATALVPLLFWWSDAVWRRIQRSFIFRIRQIATFANGPNLETSRASGHFVSFSVLDHRAQGAKPTSAFRRDVSLWRTLWFKTIAPFYLSLILVSVALGIWFS